MLWQDSRIGTGIRNFEAGFDSDWIPAAVETSFVGAVNGVSLSDNRIPAAGIASSFHRRHRPPSSSGTTLVGFYFVGAVGGVSLSDNRIPAAQIAASFHRHRRRRPPSSGTRSSGTRTIVVAVHFVVAVGCVSSSDNRIPAAGIPAAGIAASFHRRRRPPW